MNRRPLIRLSKSTLGEAEKQAVLEVLDREYLGMGRDVLQFEENLKNFLGRSVVCVNSGTAALHLALQGCGVRGGDEVLVPSLTYVATFQAISATGAKPIPCDVCPKTMTLDWRDAEKRVTRMTRAVMPVHYAGGVGALNELYEFAKRYSLRVIEDAAHAFGSKYQGRRIGSFGDVVCFSFDGIKNITAGEGGCISTEDSQVLERVKNCRLLGVEKDTDKRYAGHRSWEFDVHDQGWRYHMSNIMAAIGNEQLKKVEYIAQVRRTIAKRYVEALESIDEIEFLPLDYDSVIPHLAVLKVKDGARNCLRSFLNATGIETGIHYYPNHFLTRYKIDYPLPETENLYQQILSIPCHLDLSHEQQDFVIGKIKEFFGGK